MASRTSIINEALIELGEELITTPEDAVEQAEKANSLYDSAVETVLGKDDWKFAIRRVSLAVEADDPAYGDFKRYSKPAHFVKLVKPNYEDIYEEGDLQEEGDYLLLPTSKYDSNDPQLNIRYITKDPNEIPEGKWTSAFATAVALYIAQKMVYDFTGSASASELLFNKSKSAINSAKSLNSRGNSGVIIGDDEFINARY